MEFWKVIVGLIRRKILILPLLAAALTLGTAAYFVTPLKYVSSTTMVLVTPAFGGSLSQDPAKPNDLTNPMLSFNDNLKTASAILIYAMNTRDVAAELGALEGPTELTVDDGRTNPDLILNNGPFVYIAGESRSRTEAKDLVIRAQKRMRQELVDRQKALNAPPETYVTINDVVAPTIPKVSRTDRMRVGGFAFLLSFIMGLSAAYAWQRRLAGHPRRATLERLAKGEDTGLYRSPDRDLDRSLDPGVEELAADRSTDRVVPRLADGDQRADEDNRDETLPVAAVLRTPENEQVGGDEVPEDVEESSVVAQVGGDEVPEDVEESSVVAQVGGDEVPEDVEESSVVAQVGGDEVPEDVEESSVVAQVGGDEVPEDVEESSVAVQVGADEMRGVEADQPVEPDEVAYPEQEAETVMHWKLYVVDYPPADGGSPAHSTGDDESDLGWDWHLNDPHSNGLRQSAVVLK